jgi:hypothetical protein
MHLGLKIAFLLHDLISGQGNFVPLLKSQMAPTLNLSLLWAQGKGAQICMCGWYHSFPLTVWTEVSSSAPQLLHKELLVSPIMWRCIRRVLYLVRSSITTLDCILLKNNNLVVVVGLRPKICFQACLWVLLRLRHCHMITYDAGQSLLSTGLRKSHPIIL